MVASMVLLCFAFLGLVSGWPTGAPVESCGDLLPHHESRPSQSLARSPYKVVQSAKQYSPGQTISVTINGPAFKGFLVKAIDPATSQSVGAFVPVRGSKVLAQCGAAITHTDNNDKSGVRLSWQAPPSSGQVIFRATIVKDFHTFYQAQPATLR